MQGEAPDFVRITRTDGELLTIRDVQLRSDSITGTRLRSRSSTSAPLPIPTSDTVAVALDDVQQLEVQRISPGRTFLFVYFAAAAAVGAVAAIVCITDGGCSIP
jgi:hypothetical protein